MLTKNKVQFIELMKFEQGAQNIQVKRGIKLLSNNYCDAFKQYSQIMILVFLPKGKKPKQ